MRKGEQTLKREVSLDHQGVTGGNTRENSEPKLHGLTHRDAKHLSEGKRSVERVHEKTSWSFRENAF